MSFTNTAALAVVLVTGAPFAAQAQEPQNPAMFAAARGVLKASGAVDAMIAAMRAAIPSQRQATPQVPAEFWTHFDARMVEEAPILADSMAILYAKTFSLQELEGLTAFFNSPLGRKMVSAQPTLIAESAALGQRWGARIGEEIARALKL